MMNSFRYAILCGALLAASQPSAPCAEEQQSTAAPRLAREDAVLISLTASIEAIDHAKREVTLKGPLGNTVTAGGPIHQN